MPTSPFTPASWAPDWRKRATELPPLGVQVFANPTRLDRERVLLDLRRETGATVSLPQPLRPSAVRLS